MLYMICCTCVQVPGDEPDPVKYVDVPGVSQSMPIQLPVLSTVASNILQLDLLPGGFLNGLQ
jgi:hypothetical protein